MRSHSTPSLQVEQTATSVLNLFPDLELAVEEGEPSLAAEFFSMVRQWVGELREMVAATQAANRASMVEVRVMEGDTRHSRRGEDSKDFE